MQRRSLLLGATALLPGIGFAQAADWPRAGSTIRYVVPFPPGGLTDVMARLVGEQLGKRFGANVVIDNRPGNGGMIGADAVAKASPDGGAILAVTMSHAVNASLFKGKAPYDLQKDLKPVALLAGSPMLVVVPAASPIRDFGALLAAAKSRPLNGGSSGNGTPPHLTLAFFNQLTGSSIQHVPYKGGAPSMTDLIGGQLDVIFSNFPESIAHVKAGKLRALAIASTARHPAVPDVPTTAEAGLPELQVENWTGIMAPAALPEAIATKLGNEAVAIMKTPEMAEKAGVQGFRVDARPASEFARFLGAEVERWAKVIVAAKISAD
ncbi:MAG: tripartite tricarboxylate transporter substrate binding protein [Rubrivivax sp.]